MSEDRGVVFEKANEHEMNDKPKVKARQYGASMGVAHAGEDQDYLRRGSVDVEIYRAFAGIEFLDDSDNENDPGLIETQFVPSPEYKGQAGKTVVARATVAGVNSFGQTYFFLVKGFLGSGMLTLPLGFYNGGALFCICCLCGVCLVSIMGMNTILATRAVTGGSFSDIAKSALGNIGKAVIDISIALCQVGHGTVYIIFITQNFKAITAIWGWEVPISISGKFK